MSRTFWTLVFYTALVQVLSISLTLLKSFMTAQLTKELSQGAMTASIATLAGKRK